MQSLFTPYLWCGPQSHLHTNIKAGQWVTQSSSKSSGGLWQTDVSLEDKSPLVCVYVRWEQG